MIMMMITHDEDDDNATMTLYVLLSVKLECSPVLPISFLTFSRQLIVNRRSDCE